MLIDTSLVNIPVLVARCHAGERADHQEPGASEENAAIDEAEAAGVKAEGVVAEIDSLKMVDQRRLRRNWTLRWRIIGVLRKAVQIVLPRL